MKYFCRLSWPVLIANMIAAASEAAVRPLVVTSNVSDEQFQVVPEYERALERVLISFPDAESFHWTRNSGGLAPSNSRFIRAVFHDLLAAMPDYAEVSVVFRDRDRAAILDWNHLFETHRNLRLHAIRRAIGELDLWSQDFGELIRIDGHERFLVSDIPDDSMGAAHHMAETRRRIAASIFGEAKIVRAEFVFEGGNLLFDRVDGRLRVLIGENDIRFSKDTLRRQGVSISERTVAETISKQFGGAEVVVLHGRRTELLRHIDQAMVLLRGGVAILATVDDDSQEARLLDGYREQLESLRYRVLEIPHSGSDIERFRMSTNAVPFTHRDSGDDMVIFPVFPGEVREEAPAILSESDLIGKASAAYKAFRAARYHPLPVRDFAHVVGGNTHCITNVVY